MCHRKTLKDNEKQLRKKKVMKMDKFIVKTCKRKKRRTRRHLDEIRKRTLQLHRNNNKEAISNLVKPKVTSFITNSRLTLANKAIRSETVTRSILLNLHKEKDMIVLPHREAIDTKILTVNYKKDTLPYKVNSILKSPLRNYTEIDNHRTPDSIILFSSFSESEKVLNNLTINDVLSDSSSSVALSYTIQSDNSLYSEFMNNVVNYVQEFATDFLKTDTVLETNFLHNIVRNKNNNMPISQTHMNKCEVKNKLTITGNDKAISQYSKSQNDINMQDSLDQSWNVPSPIFHNSHEVNLQKCKFSSSSLCSGQDSPEYFYYPHRLNH